MSVGFVMLVHTALDRAAQVAQHLASAGCPIVIHVDKRVTQDQEKRLRGILRAFRDVRFCQRFKCDWGTWSIVAASKAGAEMMLKDFPDVGHVYLTSWSCMPLRPLPELLGYLAEQPDTDFIESVTTADAPWTLGGLEYERFTLYFPFSWRRQRRLFDGFVGLQRRLGVRRRPPPGVAPHQGSQWWCLTRDTLTKILTDPQRRAYQRYFRSLWIPDEAYFQTLVRLHSTSIESRSLTLSKFDFQGRPHIFYYDHLELLRRSDCFFARKIWPKADRLYQSFLSNSPLVTNNAEPNPGKIDQLFCKAVERRTNGRHGLIMQSRYPRDESKAVQTAWPYSVFQGYAQVLDGFEQWLTRATGTPAHGRLLNPDRIEFAGGATNFKGGLTTAVALRDYDEPGFLRNLVWNTRGERQYFQYTARDGLDAWLFMARDPNAQISVITGAWTIALFRSDQPFAALRREAAQLQRREAAQIDVLRAPWAQARVRIETLAGYLTSPIQPLQEIIDEASPPGGAYFGEAPRLTNLDGLGAFLQRLRNAGIQPYLAGNFPARPSAGNRERSVGNVRAAH